MSPIDLPAPVEATIREHVTGSPDREVGGFLVGELDGGRPRITAALPALEADGHRAHVTFTHQVWERALTTVDRDHPDHRIVGWYHSHPGFGIFLSDYDQFIHTNFFATPGQVALVVDPRTEASGWFGWDDGALARLDGDSPVGEPRDRRPDIQEQPGPAPAGRQRSRLLALLAAVVVGFTGGYLVAAQTAVDTVDREPPAVASGSSTDGRAAALEDELVSERSRRRAAEGQVADLAQRLEEAAGPPPDPTTRALTYRVRPGDTLRELAEAFYGAGSAMEVLLEANPTITDPDLIHVGSDLTVPAEPTGEPAQ